jgi:hypothetical protein
MNENLPPGINTNNQEAVVKVIKELEKKTHLF